MDKEFDIFLKNRKLILKIVSEISLDRLNQIPQGHRNTIAWNVTHLLVTQQLLCYVMSGLDSKLPKSLIEDFRKGTQSEFALTKVQWDEIKSWFITYAEQTVKDYQAKVFQSYNSYTTSLDVSLNSVEDAIKFNNLHEGIHLGTILSQRKLV
ncbi:MAG: DinB family protein [Flavobacteriaceae bacterium]